jgi:hypothetical protein
MKYEIPKRACPKCGAMIALCDWTHIKNCTGLPEILDFLEGFSAKKK